MRFSHLSDWLAWQERLHPNAIDLGLERVHRTLQRLGWRRPPCPIITVGGTNGKGSTVMFLRRILSEAGYRVGTFTSPHLIRYNERITVAERDVSDASLLVAFERIDVARAGETLTFFEFNTIAALLIFETSGLDAIVLEVGMGGRLDAVNAVDADVAVICSVALDHCDWLGADIEAIAREKAGILRAGRIAIFGARDMPQAVHAMADSLPCELRQLGRDYEAQHAVDKWSYVGSAVDYHGLPRPALSGAIQIDNAAAALAALESLGGRLEVPRAAIERGLRRIELAGRFQVFCCDGVEWILDVAHNPAAALALANQLRERTSVPRTFAVCGVLGDKDVDGIYAALSGCFDGWVVTALDSPRARSVDELAARMRAAGAQVVAEHAGVPGACEHVAKLARHGDRVVVFGSFLTVGPALTWLRSRCVTLT